jgi:hypothetical protein
MSSLSRGLEVEAALEAVAVQAEGGDLEEEGCPQLHPGAAGVVVVAGFRLERQLEGEAGPAAQSRMTVAMEEQLGRWWGVMAVAQGHLLLGQAVGAAPMNPAAVVPGEHWTLVAEEALPGFSQVNPGPAGKLAEGEAARPIQGPLEVVVAADLGV